MKRILPMISLWAGMLVLVVRPAIAGDVDDHEFLYGYLAGEYLVVGKELDSVKTYQGKVVFADNKDRLLVTRTIQGETVQGVGKIEKALGPDAAEVLRVRFSRAGRDYEITYIWRSDLDNYARLTGYLYQPGKRTDSPGLEALFIDHGRR